MMLWLSGLNSCTCMSRHLGHYIPCVHYAAARSLHRCLLFNAIVGCWTPTLVLAHIGVATSDCAQNVGASDSNTRKFIMLGIAQQAAWHSTSLHIKVLLLRAFTTYLHKNGSDDDKLFVLTEGTPPAGRQRCAAGQTPEALPTTWRSASWQGTPADPSLAIPAVQSPVQCSASPSCPLGQSPALPLRNQLCNEGFMTHNPVIPAETCLHCDAY